MEGMLVSTKEQTAPDPRPAGTGRLWVIWALLLVSLVFRLWYISFRQLVEDEAVYWSWSRHLAGGYLDHPPLVAYLIHGSVSLFGTNEFGVRFFSPLLATASLAILLLMAGRVLRDRRAVVWLGIIWLTSPLLAGLGTLITPDPPSIFFSLCALACVVVVLTPRETADLERPFPSPGTPGEGQGEGLQLSRRLAGQGQNTPHPSPVPEYRERGKNAADALLWLLFGIFCGLAFLSKYTTILLPASVGLALLTSPQGRRQLCRPWPYLSALPAIAIFLPVIFWNRDHDWASFRYQLNHGLQPSKQSLTLWAQFLKALLGLGRYLGSEMLVWTPVLFLAGIGVLAAFWRRFRSLPAADRLLLWSATVPLVFFAYSATRAQSEANWPAFAFFPLSILMVRWLAQTWDNGRIGLIRTGSIVAAIGLVVLQAPEVLGLVTPAKWRPAVLGKFDQLYGWRELGQVIGSANDGRLMVAERYQDAAEISFYAPGRPEVWPVGDGKRAHRSLFAFDFFDPKPDFQTVPGVVFIGFHYEWMDGKYGLHRTSMMWASGPSLSGQPRRIPLMVLDRRPQTQPGPAAAGGK